MGDTILIRGGAVQLRRMTMKKIILAAIAVAVAALLSPPVAAHHAEICQTQASKKFSKSKSKRVRYDQKCMAAHPHDRENAKR
jgi:hypothetical protein